MSHRRMTSSDIRDRLAKYGIRKTKLAAGTERAIIALLRETMVGVKQRFEERLAWIASRGYDSSDFTLTRLEENLKDLRAVLRDGYREAGTLLRRDLVAAGRLELDVQGSLLRAAADAVGTGRVFTVASKELLSSIVHSKPFQGSLLKDWARKMEAEGFRAVQSAIRTGMASSDPPQKIVSRIMGKFDRRTGRYAGGLVEGAIRREIAPVVHAAYAHVQSGAREALYLQNADLIEAQEWDSVLDQGTTDICRSRAGKLYTLDGKPIGHALPWLGGPGVAHWGCRSEALPVVEGIERTETETFAQWLPRQSYSTQVEALGRTRADLFRDGKIEVGGFTNRNGRWLTLDEIYRREGIERGAE